MENLAAGVSKESVSTGRTLSRVSPENSQRDTSDLSFLGAGESSKSHHPASITPGRHTSLKRTADGSWKSQKYGTDNVTPVLPGNAIPKPQDSNCKSSTKAKPPIPLDSDGPTRALKSTKSALGRLSRKLTGGPLDLDDAEKIGDIQQPVFRVPETKTAPIGSTNRRPKNRESRLRHKYRAPSPPAVPSIQQTLSPKHVSDNTNEVSAVTLNSLPYCSDRSVLPTRGELSLPATPSINSNHQRGEDISDRSTSPRVHRNEIQPSKLSNPHTQELHRPCFVTADLTKFDNTLPPPNATQKATLNPDRRDHVDLPASTASEDLQISKMSTHPGTKGRFDQRRNQKLSSIARPTPSSRSRPDVPALTSSPTSVSALSVGRENQNPKATNQRPSRVRRQTLSILDPIYTSAESNGHKPSVKAIYLRDQQLCAGLAVSTKGMMRPYLGFDEREPLMNNTDGLLIADQKQHLSKGTIIHIDFTKREMEIIEDVIYHISGEVDAWGTAEQVKDRLMQLLDGLSYDQWARALRHVRRSEQLRNRDSGSLLRFFKDATAGCLPSRPMLLQLAAPVKHTPPGFLAEQSVSSLLRHRQMGSGRVRSGHTSTKAMNEKIIAQTCENLVPWRSYTGASNDVMVVAWSPDGNKHAAGASAESSSYNMQYNRRNNLLLGDLELNVLIELPDHRIERPLPSSFADGPNSLQATYDACDPMLYITLTGVAFSATGNRLYTSSYDHTVKVWDVANSSQAKCVATLQHEDQVELLATSDQFHNVLTTGTRVLEDSIRIYNVAVENDDVPLSTFITLSSPKAMKDAVKELYPSVLRWGNSPQVHGYLLAGFSPRPKDEELETDDPAPDGDLCLWDIGAQKPIEVTPHSQNVFDCVWHPTLPIFATGSTCGGGIVDRSTRSVVRVYEPIHQRGKTIEYECPALDMNDVTFW